MGVLYILLPWESDQDPLATKSSAILPSVNALFRTFNWMESSGSGGTSTVATRQNSSETQLAYVEQTLRLKDDHNLRPDRKARRHAFLDYLNVYLLTCDYQAKMQQHGTFEQSPVAYLLAQTADTDLIEACDSQEAFENLVQNQDKRLLKWLRAWGMNLEEIQMIQGM